MLFIFEHLVPAPNLPRPGKLLDVYTMVSGPRRKAEYTDLMQITGVETFES